MDRAGVDRAGVDCAASDPGGTLSPSFTRGAYPYRPTARVGQSDLRTPTADQSGAGYPRADYPRADYPREPTERSRKPRFAGRSANLRIR